MKLSFFCRWFRFELYVTLIFFENSSSLFPFIQYDGSKTEIVELGKFECTSNKTQYNYFMNFIIKRKLNYFDTISHNFLS